MNIPAKPPPQKLPPSGRTEQRGVVGGLMMYALLSMAVGVPFFLAFVAIIVSLAFVSYSKPRASANRNTAASVSTEPQLPAGWRTYRSPTGQFFIALPGEFEAHGSSPSNRMRTFGFVNSWSSDGCVATVEFTDTPHKLDAARFNLLENTADNKVKNLSGSVSQRADYLSNGTSGLAFEFTATYDDRPHVGRGRVYLVDDRLFTLTWLAPKEVGVDSRCNQFLDSFRPEKRRTAITRD